MVKIWMKKKPEEFVAAEWCRECGFIDNNISFFAFGICTGGNDGNGMTHKPATMIRIRQAKGHRPPPNRLSIFRK